jgi:hypothetical protein
MVRSFVLRALVAVGLSLGLAHFATAQSRPAIPNITSTPNTPSMPSGPEASVGSPGCAEGCGAGAMGRGRFRLLNDDGGMPPHYAYYPAMHGYYYFCPYHPMHIINHQAMATQWGMDPRNPYANDFFKVVYAEYKTAQGASPILQEGSPEQIPTPLPVPPPRKSGRTK